MKTQRLISAVEGKAATTLVAALLAALCAPDAPGSSGMNPVPPSTAGYTVGSVIESGQRGGRLLTAGTNFTQEYNREMGLAMEAWNAHSWDAARDRFERIYQDHPASPWAAEAELHVACYLKHKGIFDEAEERFLSVLRKALHYLPHLYYETGRFSEAHDALDLLGGLDTTWKERQHVEIWGRIIRRAELADRRNRLCGTTPWRSPWECGTRRGDVRRRFPFPMSTSPRCAAAIRGPRRRPRTPMAIRFRNWLSWVPEHLCGSASSSSKSRLRTRRLFSRT